MALAVVAPAAGANYGRLEATAGCDRVVTWRASASVEGSDRGPDQRTGRGAATGHRAVMASGPTQARRAASAPPTTSASAARSSCPRASSAVDLEVVPLVPWGPERDGDAPGAPRFATAEVPGECEDQPLAATPAARLLDRLGDGAGAQRRPATPRRRGGRRPRRRTRTDDRAGEHLGARRAGARRAGHADPGARRGLRRLGPDPGSRLRGRWADGGGHRAVRRPRRSSGGVRHQRGPVGRRRGRGARGGGRPGDDRVRHGAAARTGRACGRAARRGASRRPGGGSGADRRVRRAGRRAARLRNCRPCRLRSVRDPADHAAGADHAAATSPDRAPLGQPYLARVRRSERSACCSEDCSCSAGAACWRLGIDVVRPPRRSARPWSPTANGGGTSSDRMRATLRLAGDTAAPPNDSCRR